MKNYNPKMKSELHCRWIEADETLDRELIVHDSKLGLVHVLNSAAGIIFELCNGKYTIDDMVTQIEEKFETGAEDVYPDINECLNSFRELKLLV